jgi:hypothetical protein
MATDKRQLTINAIKAAMALIKIADGYYSNIGEKVTEGKDNPYGNNRVDGVDIIDPHDATRDITEDTALEEHTLQIEIKTISKSAVSPETARQHIADVRKAMLTLFSDPWASKNLDDVRHVENDWELDQVGVKIIGTRLKFEIDFKTLKLQEV